MATQAEIAAKLLAIIIIIGFVVIAVFGLFLMNATNKDLVKKGLLKSAVIEQNNLIFEVEEDYASGLIIGYNNKTIYSQNFQVGEKISKLSIENYPSMINDKKVYHFMLYHYELGGNQFSGFDFCVIGDTVMYGKNIKKCHDD